MTRKQLPFFAAFIVLLFGAMACACLGSGVGLGGITATANAALTQAVMTVTAAAGGNTTGAATPAAAATTASGGGGGSTAPGGPSDIPLPDAQNTIQAATAQAVAFTTSADVATVTKFYKDAMPKNGWTENTGLSVQTANQAALTFTKDNRTASIGIASTGAQTAVGIAVK